MQTKKLFVLLAFLGVAAMTSAQVTFEAMEGKNWGGEQQIDKLFDNTTLKWCTNSDGAWFTFKTKTSEAVVLTGYAIRSGDDGVYTNYDRSPKTWIIYGSNNDSNHGKDGDWTQISSVTNDDTMYWTDVNDENKKKCENHKTFYFAIENNTTPYKYYKIVFEAVQNSDIIQIGEFIPSYLISGSDTHTNCGASYHTYSMNGSINQQVDVCDVCNKVIYSDQHRGIKIADGKPFSVIGGGWGEGYGNFTYTRPCSSMGSICLPYNLKNVGTRTDAKYYTLKSYNSVTDALVFERVTENLTYYTPAIYILNDKNAESIDLSCNGAGFQITPTTSVTASVIDVEDDGWAMVGTLKDGTASESGNSIFYLKSGSFKRCYEGGSISFKPYRAYITGPASASGVKAFGIADDMEDAINSLTPTLTEGEVVLYDLSGRKVNDIRHGEIYIMNGRKVMFNK